MEQRLDGIIIRQRMTTDGTDCMGSSSDREWPLMEQTPWDRHQIENDHWWNRLHGIVIRQRMTTDGAKTAWDRHQTENDIIRGIITREWHLLEQRIHGIFIWYRMTSTEAKIHGHNRHFLNNTPIKGPWLCKGSCPASNKTYGFCGR